MLIKKFLTFSFFIFIIICAFFLGSFGQEKFSPLAKIIPTTTQIIYPTPIPALTTDGLFKLVNDYRIKNNLTSLVKNAILCNFAKERAEYLIKNIADWSHDGFKTLAPKYRNLMGNTNSSFGENLAKDFYANYDVRNAWINSPKHKEELDQPLYTKGCVDIEHFFSNAYVVLIFSSDEIQVPVANPEEPILCPLPVECGGGTIPLKRGECESSTCCGFLSGKWVFYKDKNQCIEDQKKERG